MAGKKVQAPTRRYVSLATDSWAFKTLEQATKEAQSNAKEDGENYAVAEVVSVFGTPPASALKLPVTDEVLGN